MKNKFILFLFLALPLQLLIAQNADINLLRNINSSSPSGDNFFKLVSQSASPVSLLAPIGLFAVGYLEKDKSLKEKAIFVAATVLVSSAVSTGLKYAIRRDRPFVTYPNLIYKKSDGGSPSFPSGHTSVAFASATSLTLAFPKWYVGVPAFAWASAVGYSRMHLGVHYPSDVLAGAAVGIGSAYLCSWLQRRIFR